MSLIKIPSKFICQNQNDRTREYYVNISSLMCFEVSKYVQEVYDTKKKEHTGEFETMYCAAMIMDNNYYVPIKSNFTEQEFQEFLLWTNKNLAFANIKE